MRTFLFIAARNCAAAAACIFLLASCGDEASDGARGALGVGTSGSPTLEIQNSTSGFGCIATPQATRIANGERLEVVVRTINPSGDVFMRGYRITEPEFSVFYTARNPNAGDLLVRHTLTLTDSDQNEASCQLQVTVTGEPFRQF